MDILPVLFTSKTRGLNFVLKGKRSFHFSEFNSFTKIKDEFETCDLIFLMPDQLQFLPKKTIDLFVAINFLQDLKKDPKNFYLFEEYPIKKN